MSRVIKFRTYDGENIIYFDLALCNSESIQWAAHTLTHPIMQFTGLQDANGTEIYEGDIVRCASRRACPHAVIWTEIGNDNFGSVPGWYLSGINNPGYSFTGAEEIIGNIHESQELLEE